MRTLLILAFVAAAAPFSAKAAPLDTAAEFGARPSVIHASLSPDGRSVAYVAPGKGLESILFTVGVDKDAKPRAALVLTGKPERLGNCDWVTNDRLVCLVYGVVEGVAGSFQGLLPFTRTIAVNADGSNFLQLSTRANPYSRGVQLGGGGIVDWLPEKDGAVLMTRHYLPNDHLGTLFGSTKEGLGVDQIDTRTLKTSVVEPPKENVAQYWSDGHGAIRVMGVWGPRSAGQDTGIMLYYFRAPGSQDWQKLGEYNSVDQSGFLPYQVDREKNAVYGVKKKDGRLAIYTVSLDASLREELIYASDSVDVTDLIRIGRRQRVVGVSYVTDIRRTQYFDPDVEKLTAALSKVLPDHPAVRVIDSSAEEGKLLIYTSRDDNPGMYYLFDRQTHQLRPLLAVREELDGVKLASVTPITYTAGDGTSVPGYVTYPVGKENAKGLPAIVLPHGGPGARDEWGFNWLAQYFAARGFVVLQPNFRGSSGYGDDWYERNGFRSWPAAIGDVLDAGRWLTAQGIADPGKLAVVGWSYGGYAALQSAVTDPTVFKAVVAIAPVTDLNDLVEEWRHFTNHVLMENFVGDSATLHAGSPAENADKIKVPVLLFHGALDRNVAIGESRRMDDSLQRAGVKHELVTWEDLDHRLDDSGARADMLRKSDAFLRQALGMSM
jgi:dipeptidyl aminopeptidase/acylaminoacyl peptidase